MYQIILLSLFATAFAAPKTNHDVQAVPSCDDTKCVLPNCRCASTSAPIKGDIKQIPQFVFLTFDDAVQALNYETYANLFYNRTNPDGCPVQATFFVTHDYTDYTKVHDLYAHGHEIALHSITHEAQTEYWKNITIDQLDREFGDEKVMVTKYANIPDEAIQGMRLPFLQLSGDNSFLLGKQIGLSYDCSWPTQTYRNPGLWPYTLDYRTFQDCPIGPCPSSSIPGMWVVPMIDWTDEINIVCSMVDACVNIPSDTDHLLQWFIDNFNSQYQGNRAPFGFYVHNAYFNVNPIHLDAYQKFVDYLQTLPDVYLVGPSKALKWIQNPVPLNSPDWPACVEVEDLGCDLQTCPLSFEDSTRYMTICGDCPQGYPWLGDPLGEEEK